MPFSDEPLSCYLHALYGKEVIHVNKAYDEIDNAEEEQNPRGAAEKDKIEEKEKNKDPQQTFPEHEPRPFLNVQRRDDQEDPQKNNDEAEDIDHDHVVDIYRHGQGRSPEPQGIVQPVRSVEECLERVRTQKRCVGYDVENPGPENPPPEMYGL